MKTPRLFGLSVLSIALFACALSAADMPVIGDATAPAAPAAASTPAPAATSAATAPTSSPDISTPLKSGQEIILFPEGVPGWKDIGPEQFARGTYTNISNPRMICSLPPAGTPQNGTAIIFCAGGGYVHVALGGGMNSWLNPLGVTTFNLIYRCAEFGAPAPQQDVLRAVRLIRAHAKEFGIDPNHIGVMGDSAGSHVAASAATLFDEPLGKTGAELDKFSARPDFAILLFSVLTMEPPYAHGDSKKNLLGANPTQAMMDQYSLEKHVTAQTPPVFIVHTEMDTTVREENDLLFYAALRKANVPAEMHLYYDGTHGSGLDANFGPTALWQKFCEEWLRFNGWIPPSPTSMMKVQVRPAATGRGARGAPAPARGARGAPPATTAPTAAATDAASPTPAASPAESATPFAAP